MSPPAKSPPLTKPRRPLRQAPSATGAGRESKGDLGLFAVFLPISFGSSLGEAGMSPPRSKPLDSPLASEPLLSEVLEMFVEEMPQHAAKLRRCFDNREWHALRHALRQLNTAASRSGFDQLLGVSARLETKITRRAPTPEVGASLDELLSQCRRLTTR